MNREWLKAFYGESNGAELAEGLLGARNAKDRARVLAKASRLDTRLEQIPRSAGLICTPQRRRRGKDTIRRIQSGR